MEEQIQHYNNDPFKLYDPNQDQSFNDQQQQQDQLFNPSSRDNSINSNTSNDFEIIQKSTLLSLLKDEFESLDLAQDELDKLIKQKLDNYNQSFDQDEEVKAPQNNFQRNLSTEPYDEITIDPQSEDMREIYGIDSFEYLDEKDIDVKDYHQNHQVKINLTLKQKLMQQMTNIGFKYMKDGANKAILKDQQRNLFIYIFSNIKKKEQNGVTVRNLTTDCNWGCTIRSAQMMIANALQQSTFMYPVNSILKLFDDNIRECTESAFSIQNIAIQGLQIGRFPGDWYGVSSITTILQSLNDNYKPFSQFEICTFQDGYIVFETIMKKGCQLVNEKQDQQLQKDSIVLNQKDQSEYDPQNRENYDDLTFSQMGLGCDRRINYDKLPNMDQDQNPFNNQEWKNEVLVIVNVRLGLQKIDPIYHQIIVKYMQMPQFVGLVGGKPNKAFYFFGHIIDLDTNKVKLMFLDPHKVQDYTYDVETSYDLDVKEQAKFHTTEARLLKIKELDTCLGFGFLIKSLQDFNQFKTLLESNIQEDLDHSIFSLYQHESELDNNSQMFSIRSFNSRFVSQV
eukprot:403370248